MVWTVPSCEMAAEKGTVHIKIILHAMFHALQKINFYFLGAHHLRSHCIYDRSSFVPKPYPASITCSMVIARGSWMGPGNETTLVYKISIQNNAIQAECFI